MSEYASELNLDETHLPQFKRKKLNCVSPKELDSNGALKDAKGNEENFQTSIVVSNEMKDENFNCFANDDDDVDAKGGALSIRGILCELGFGYLASHISEQCADQIVNMAIEISRRNQIRTTKSNVGSGSSDMDKEMKDKWESEIDDSFIKLNENDSSIKLNKNDSGSTIQERISLSLDEGDSSIGSERDTEDENDDANSLSSLLDELDTEYKSLTEIFSMLNEEDLIYFGRITDPIEIIAKINEIVRMKSLASFSRKSLEGINNEDDAIELIKNANKIIVITGAGISVSCGIPDFRSPNGLYDQIRAKYNLSDPRLLFDIHFLKKDQTLFYDFAHRLLPIDGSKPSKSHKFIKLLQEKNKLLRNYSQNIDTLEKKAGIEADKLVLCHGSFATFSCPNGHKVSCEDIKFQVANKIVPQCAICDDPTGSCFLRPDIVFFGEPLPDSFHANINSDINEVDLLIVMGSSLRVQPVSLIPILIGKIHPNVPQLFFNRVTVSKPYQFDWYFLSDCDESVERISQKLNWTLE